MDSSFGTFFTPNITPDPATGIGDWSEADFWNALHQGERPDGTPLYPACPYPNFTRVRRDDVSAIYAYLRSVPAVRRSVPEHDLPFPVADRSSQWNRGAYLVEGLGHCGACHSDKNLFGASRSGDKVPGYRVHGWYAPSLLSSAEAGLQAWPLEAAAALLKHGKAGDAATMGPMADVVDASLRFLSDADALAMAVYLKSLPEREVASDVRLLRLSAPRFEAAKALGRDIYQELCQDCHGSEGEGTIAAPALAGNRAVLLPDPVNIVNIIRDGGYPPSTAGNPRPFGMPSFRELSVPELAAVVTYIRTSWRNDAAPVSTADIG